MKVKITTKCYKPPRMVFGDLKIRIRWSMGKKCKNKKLYISFIQVKWKKGEDLGSDKKQRTELLFPILKLLLGNGERVQNCKTSSKHAEMRVSD